MKKSPIDLSELQLALESNDGGLGLHTYWFDTRTGDVIFLTEDLEEQDELREQIEENSDNRFVQIEPIASHDGFRIMEDFVQALPQTRIREKLEWSLNGPKPFRRFKDALHENQAVREQWHKFYDEALAGYAIGWLAELDIQPLSEASRSDIGSGSVLRSDDRQYPRSSRVRGMDGSGGKRASTFDRARIALATIRSGDIAR